MGIDEEMGRRGGEKKWKDGRRRRGGLNTWCRTAVSWNSCCVSTALYYPALYYPALYYPAVYYPALYYPALYYPAL